MSEKKGASNKVINKKERGKKERGREDKCNKGSKQA
jgi:hypothetical protein